jgi:hypothetical protein
VRLLRHLSHNQLPNSESCPATHIVKLHIKKQPQQQQQQQQQQSSE